MAKDYDAEGCVITKASIPRLHLAALGIVFGDAGTSPKHFCQTRLKRLLAIKSGGPPMLMVWPIKRDAMITTCMVSTRPDRWAPVEC